MHESRRVIVSSIVFIALLSGTALLYNSFFLEVREILSTAVSNTEVGPLSFLPASLVVLVLNILMMALFLTGRLIVGPLKSKMIDVFWLVRSSVVLFCIIALLFTPVLSLIFGGTGIALGLWLTATAGFTITIIMVSNS